MNRTYINEVQKEIGNTVKVQGFIEKPAQQQVYGLYRTEGYHRQAADHG